MDIARVTNKTQAARSALQKTLGGDKGRNFRALLVRILASWVSEFDTGAKITVEFAHISRELFEQVVDGLKTAKGINAVNVREFDEQLKSIIEVESNIKAYDLGKLISSVSDGHLKVEHTTNDYIQMNVSEGSSTADILVIVLGVIVVLFLLVLNHGKLERQEIIKQGKIMKLVKVRIGRATVLMMAMTVLLMIGNGCVMKNPHVGRNYKVNLKPVYVANLPSKTAIKCKIQVSLPKDLRDKQYAANVIGHVRNGLGMPMANITATPNINIWVQNCISGNLKRVGFDAITGKMTSNGLYISTSIRSLECSAMFSYNASAILDVKINDNNSTLFKQAFTGKASQPNWMSSSEGYRETLTKAMQQCLNKMLPVLIKELEKAGKTIPNTVIVPDKKISKQVPKTTTAAKQKIKVKKDSKKSLDDIYF